MGEEDFAGDDRKRNVEVGREGDEREGPEKGCVCVRLRGLGSVGWVGGTGVGLRRGW